MSSPRNPRRLAPLFALATAALFAPEAAAQFTSGNLVVVRVGDGAAALSSSATATFLDEYTPAGVLVQTVALPTVASGANRIMTNAGSSTSEGFLNLSVDGNWLTCGGYDATVGTLTVATTTSAANARVVARIDLNAVIDTSTALADAYSGGNIRGVATDNGTQFWTSGTSTASGSARYATLGATASTQLSTTITNTRVIGIAGGQLYVSSATGAFQGVSTVGTGLPTTTGQTITLLNGFPVATGPSSYDYFFADANTLYIADDRTNGAGGIQKWTQSGGLWTLQYTLALNATTGCRGLSGRVSAGVATLFATTGLASANNIVTVVDAGAASPVTVVATTIANAALRGLRWLPERGSIARTPHGCGPTTITVTGHPRTGGTIKTTLGAVAGSPFIGLGLMLGTTPFCGCNIGHSWLIAIPGATLSVIVPLSPALVGGKVGFQGLDAFAPGGCPAPMITLTDTIAVSIG